MYSIVFCLIMGFEESIKQIVANEIAALKDELTRLREAIEDKNARRYVMHTKDVLDELGISEKTLIDYKNEGLLKEHRLKEGGKQYFKRDEVFSFLESDAPQAKSIRRKKRQNPLRKVK